MYCACIGAVVFELLLHMHGGMHWCGLPAKVTSLKLQMWDGKHLNYLHNKATLVVSAYFETALLWTPMREGGPELHE